MVIHRPIFWLLIVIFLMSFTQSASSAEVPPWDGKTIKTDGLVYARFSDYREPRKVGFTTWIYFAKNGSVFLYFNARDGIELPGLGVKKTRRNGSLDMNGVVYQVDGGFLVDYGQTDRKSGMVMQIRATVGISKPSACKLRAWDYELKMRPNPKHQLLGYSAKPSSCVTMDGPPF